MNATYFSALWLAIVTVAILCIRAGRKSLQDGYRKRGAIYRAFGVFLVLFALGIVIGPGPYRVRCLARRTQCQSNLHQFDLALQAHCYPPQEVYPNSLSQLSPDVVAPKLFVCPGSGNAPGKLENADEWMDYIYVKGLSPTSPADVPVVMCSSMFHMDMGANALMGDHSCTWFTNFADTEAVLQNLYDRGYQFHVSDRVQLQFCGRLRSSDRWTDTIWNRAVPVKFPEAVHRRMLVDGVSIIIGISVLLFIVARSMALRASPRARLSLLGTPLLMAIVYLVWIRDSAWQLRLLQGSNAFSYSQWLLPLACFGAGVLSTRENIRPGRRAVLAFALVIVSSLELVLPFISRAPVAVERRDEWVTLQGSDTSCGAAACASLLRVSGMEVSETDAVRACLTTHRGTSWQGMHRGLCLLSADNAEVVAQKASSIDDVRLPALVTVVLRSKEGACKQYHEKWGWDAGEPHSVVVLRKQDADSYVVGDPAVGVEVWDKSAFDVLWNGEALLLKPVAGHRPGGRGHRAAF